MLTDPRGRRNTYAEISWEPYYFRHGYPSEAFRELNWYAMERLRRHLRRRSQRAYRIPEEESAYDHLRRLGFQPLRGYPESGLGPRIPLVSETCIIAQPTIPPMRKPYTTPSLAAGPVRSTSAR